ncbi:MAG: acyl-CoA dehydrogenase family protein [Deltaproteobacteria bacterium]|nr:acyl-CoA dehydrogenase family protein [Deltaproteobacteria bacterium]
MEFKLSKSQKEIQKAARDFAKGEFDKDLAMELEKAQMFPHEILEMAAELEFIGSHFDEKYGGGGMAVLDNSLLAEELCRKDPTFGSALMMGGYGAECLLRYGISELKDKYIPLVVDGKILSGLALSETGTGTGISVTTTATKDGDAWLINGDKVRVINGGLAGFYCVLCRTNSEVDPVKGHSMILVEADRNGLSVDDKSDTVGLRMTAFADVHFENVRVPHSNLIGKEGKGMKQALAVMNESRVLMASLALGIGQGALERTVDYVKQRVQFGKKIAQFQATQHKLADMAVKLEQARTLTYLAAWQCDQKKPDTKFMAMAKLSATRSALEASHQAIQLYGGYGYCSEYEVERCCRDAKTLQIIGGNTGFLKDTVAGSVIGKIR